MVRAKSPIQIAIAVPQPRLDWRWTGLNQVDWTVVVAVIAMRMMQATLNQVVDMIPVLNRFVTAAVAVDMSGLVA